MQSSTQQQQSNEQLTSEQKLAQAVSDYYSDPLGFVLFAFDWDSSELSGFGGPDQWQVEFLTEISEQVRERGFNGVDPVRAIQFATSSGHGIGKSAITAWLILWIMSTRPHAKGVVTANTSDQLKTKTWAELGKWTKRCITGHWFAYNNSKGNMNLIHKRHPQTWRVDGQTCREENSESFAGLHSANSSPFYIYDEASAVPDKIWEVSEGGLTDGEPFWFVFGNPTRNTGRFRECFGRLKHRWITRQIDSRNVKITNKLKIAHWVDDYGEDSDFVRVRVRGVFPRASSTQFIPGDLVQTAMKRTVGDDDGAAVIIGVDVARYGDDQSVIYTRIGRDGKNVKPLKFRELSTMDLAARVIEHAEKLGNVDAIMVDGVGVGGGVVDRVRQLGYNVFDVSAGAQADDSKRYRNKRAEMWARMAEWLEDGGIPDDPELEQELTGIEYGFTDSGQIQLERKEDMKKRGLSSPDIADALALTFAHRVARKDLPKISRRARMGTRTAVTEYSVF